MGFRPTIWATVLAVPVLITLIGLGTWQVQRLQWKNELIENRSARITLPPVPTISLAAVREGRVEGSELAALEYRPVVLEGSYVGEQSLRLLPRLRDGRRGFHLVSPLDTGGPLGTVIVDRGWAPLDAAAQAVSTPAGPVRVEGFVRLYVEPGMFVPDNEPEANNWFFLDESAMLAAAGAAPGLPARFYVQAGPTSTRPGMFPVGSVPDTNLRNSHLEYAVTWYAFAVVFVVIFVLFHWRRRET